MKNTEMKNKDKFSDQEVVGHQKNSEDTTLFDTVYNKARNVNKNATGGLKWRCVAVGAEIKDDDTELSSVEHSVATHANNQDDNINLMVDESEVRVLGGGQDDLGTYVGSMIDDGREILLVDVDGDVTFDAMEVDKASISETSDNEIADIVSE